MPSTPYQTTVSTTGSVRGQYTHTIGSIPLSGITAADILTDYVINHDFKIVDIRACVNTAATTGSKAATLTAKIKPSGGSAASVTGAALGLTSANMTPIGKVVTATATDLLAGGNNRGNAGDSISVTASGVTSFVEGTATIVLTLQNLDCA